MAPLPSLFVSHGSPMILLDDCPARRFFGEYGASLARPAAILMISAHWETPGVTVATTDRPETIHDFHGFPDAMYRFRYRAPGAPDIAAQAAACLRRDGFDVAADPRRGLDHGAWVPLAYMFPDAGIPVAQVSIQPQLGARHHYELGQALAPLRDKGVLILGSGNITHGRRAGPVDMPALAWVSGFSDWVFGAVSEDRIDDLLNYRARAPYAGANHPTEDHFLPLLFALGAAGKESEPRRVHASYTYGTISMDCYAFD
jgi:4,5-DOPA dioxygenase extradiol